MEEFFIVQDEGERIIFETAVIVADVPMRDKRTFSPNACRKIVEMNREQAELRLLPLLLATDERRKPPQDAVCANFIDLYFEDGRIVGVIETGSNYRGFILRKAVLETPEKVRFMFFGEGDMMRSGDGLVKIVDIYGFSCFCVYVEN